MPTPPKKSAIIKTIKSWSFSAWKTYMSCPFKSYCKAILKLSEPGSPALDNGNRVHLLAQAYVGKAVPEMGYKEPERSKELVTALTKAASGKLPKELDTFAVEFKTIREKNYKTEESWAFRKDWTITRNDDWQGAWCRVKIDAHSVQTRRGVMTDYKTGKKYPEKHDESLELYALAMFIMYPQLLTVTAALWYLDIGEETVREFDVSEVPELKKLWAKRTAKMMLDTRFTPKPSNFECRYCHFSKSKGGPCKH